MRPTPGNRLWSLLPYAAITALLVLSGFALWSVRDLSQETRVRHELGLRAQLDGRVSMFEQNLVAELDTMLQAASDPDADLAALQALWRRTHPWFDALYVWQVVERDGAPAPEVRFLHPNTRLRVDETAWEVCTQRARRMAMPERDRRTVAARLLVVCADQPRAVRALLSAESARMYRAEGLPHAALEALEVVDLDDRAPLRTAPDVGPALRVSRRLLLADLFDDIGEGSQADNLRRATVAEILALDAPELEATLYLVPNLLESLEARGRDVRLLRAGIPAAEQRLAAFREIRQTAARPGTSGVTEGARFTYDQYSDMPYLLYSLRYDDQRGGVALQLSQEQLLHAFLASDKTLADSIVVLDVAGRSVAGARGAELSDISVPFRETLRHLRTGLTAAYVEANAPRGTTGLAAVVGTVTAMCVLLGLGAIWAQQQANERQRMLLQRQRDFTARVTHELKTPLAGMRVMAENLAAGAYRDDQQRELMARRIVEEADRLTARVEEILQVARKREVPAPEPVDPEEVLLELVDEWGPRYEQAGIRLTADLDPVDPIVGDPKAIRDAVACLLDNAWKYRREDIASHVWLHLRQDGRWIEIEVVDNGLGVPPSMRSAIFEQFVRVEGPNRGKAGGHGLGLYQVHEIVTAHRGTVRCEDGVDGGARFVVRLPAKAGSSLRG